MSLKTLRFVFGHGVTHARITPDTTRIVPSGLMMFLIPVTEYILSMVAHTVGESEAKTAIILYIALFWVPPHNKLLSTLSLL